MNSPGVSRRSPSPTRRLWRLAYWLPRDFLLWARLGFPRRLIYFGGRGYGDTLLLGTVAHELHRRGILTAVLTEHPELLRGLPAVSGALRHEWRALEAVARFGGGAQHVPYFLTPCPPTHDIPPDHHIIVEMCRRAGVRGEISLRTYFALGSLERAAGRLHPRQAVVQALGPQSENLSPLKAYPADRLAAVVEATAADLHWIQLGSSNDPRVPGVRDLRGRTTAAESAGLLAHSQLFLGPPGFLMHLARAVDCRSVIIFGGRELPRHGGYQCNENLFSPQSCAPCYRRSTCLLQLECLTVISPSSVVDAVRRTAALRGKPIAVETAIVPPAATPFPLPWLPPIPAAI